MERRAFLELALAAAFGVPLSACGRGSPSEDEETVQRNVREQEADARPAIADPLPSIGQYDTILLASPIWNVRAPMIMTTFAEAYDFSGKTTGTAVDSWLGRTDLLN